MRALSRLAAVAHCADEAEVRRLLQQARGDGDDRSTELGRWSSAGGESLHRMVEFNEDYGALEALLEVEDIDVNWIAKDGLTALHVACWKGRDGAVRILMRREDLDVNARIAFDLTPLHLAARLGHVRVVEELVKDVCGSRLVVDARTVHEFTALHLVVEGGEDFSGSGLRVRRGSVEERCAVVAVLRAEQEKRGNLIGFENCRDVLGRTALHYAARSGCAEMVRELLAFSDVNPNIVDNYGLAPLHLAVQRGHVSASSLLMHAHNIDLNCESCGVDIRNVIMPQEYHHVSTSFGVDFKMRLLYPKVLFDEPEPCDVTGVNVTPIHIAGSGGHYEILSFLLNTRCVNLRAVDFRGFTALHCAVASGSIRAVKLLMNQQCDIDLMNCCDFEGRTPLVLSVVHCHLEVLKALLIGEDCGPVNFHLPSEHSLHLAMELLAVATQQGSCHRVIAHYLLDLLEDSVRGYEGCCSDSTSLVHWAAKNGNTELMKLILAWKPEAVNATTDKAKQTPLHLATIHGHTELVECLCNDSSETGWRLRAAEIDKTGAMPLDYAFEQGKKAREIQNLLLRRGDVKEHMERIYRLDMNTMNALFVGAALLASVTYIGWMQPPLGFGEDYRYPLDSPPAPPETYAVFVQSRNPSVRLFLIFNTLAFIFSLTTIFRGIEALARHSKKLDAGYVPRYLRASIRHCYVYFSLSTSFIIAAFDQAGRAVLPPNQLWYLTPIMFSLWGSWGLLCLFMCRKHIKRNIRGCWSRKWYQIPKLIASRFNRCL